MRELTMLVCNCEFADVVCDVLLLLEFEYEPAEPGWAECPAQGACVPELRVKVQNVPHVRRTPRSESPLLFWSELQAEIDRRLAEPGSRLRERIERYIVECMADARAESRHYADEEV